ncbi:MAG: AmmeMemoRadiSam system protein B [Dictyoglomaceae bacterium]|nr:AmmeMemoRadiSam system protein B [Dictyoglomaceae bacterium]
MKRLPQVAGYFYPRYKEELIKYLEKFIERVKNPIKAKGCISPHAGYIYSGSTAGKVYSCIDIPNKAIILGPNHHGLGYPSAIYSKGSWLTPLGESKIDEELAEKILKNSKFLKEDSSAHAMEHSLEVQLPFLQYLNPEIKIVPITISDYSWKNFEDLAYAISNCIDEEVLIIASSDFSHYEPQEVVKEKDYYAIEAILNIDPKEFYERVKKRKISICGVGPIIILLLILNSLGIKNSKLVDYKTSGDITQEYDAVVGYAGIIFF